MFLIFWFFEYHINQSKYNEKFKAEEFELDTCKVFYH